MTSCPCPMLTLCTSFFLRLARPMIRSVGSLPIERMQMKGVRSLLSECICSTLSGCESTYLDPSTSAMYSCATIMVRSVRMARTSSILCILSRRSLISGTLTASGASWSYHWSHMASLRKIRSGRSLKVGSRRESSRQLSHAASGIQFLGFLRSDTMSSAAPPLRKQLKWSSVMRFWLSCTLRARSSEKTSLCFSNSPRPM
mmetsp:Transcript_54079/g.132221  ORF Transcript_54079/g.132221 Transcript_54079/m.132221 type:complete len:201 (-) Transcript_54079:102-704(-)